MVVQPFILHFTLYIYVLKLFQFDVNHVRLCLYIAYNVEKIKELFIVVSCRAIYD